MERKLIKQGRGEGGYTIYLPKKWVDENNLIKGNELSITPVGKDLIISTKPTDKKTETTIKLTSNDESWVRTLITNTYRAGYDRIKISYDSEKQFTLLQEIIKKNLIGFEIIKKEDKFCIVENITEPTSDQFDNILKKMFMNIEDLLMITRKRLTGGIPSENFCEVEERILKFDNFCRRVIIKEKLIKQRSELFWTFLAHIIHGQRELFHLNENLDKKITVSKNTLDILEKSEDIFKLIEKSYFEKDMEILGRVHTIEKEIIKKTNQLIQKNSGKENWIILYLSNSARQFYLANSPLTGMII